MMIWEWFNFTYFRRNNQDRALEEAEEKWKHFNFSQCIQSGIHKNTPVHPSQSFMYFS